MCCLISKTTFSAVFELSGEEEHRVNYRSSTRDDSHRFIFEFEGSKRLTYLPHKGYIEGHE